MAVQHARMTSFTARTTLKLQKVQNKLFQSNYMKVAPLAMQKMSLIEYVGM